MRKVYGETPPSCRAIGEIYAASNYSLAWVGYWHPGIWNETMFVAQS
jgi:hypothetical protein